MLRLVHHVHYVVHDRDAMVEYLEKNFGMKPTELVVFEKRGFKDALYDVGETQMQFTQPLDPDSHIGRYLAEHGPGVYHVAWGVKDLRKVAAHLVAKGNKMRGRGENGVQESPRGGLTTNIALESSQGVWFQLAEDPPA